MVDLDMFKEYMLSRSIVLFMAKHFNMSFQMVKLKLNEAWQSCKESVYVADENILGCTIDIFMTTEGGFTFITPDFAHKLAATKLDTSVKFRFLTLLVRQLGFHFAKIQNGLAGSPQHQNYISFGAIFYGGAFKYEVIESDSRLVEFILDEDNWSEPFEETLTSKFPYLVSKVIGINTD